MNKTYVVIGSSAAGLAALATLKRIDRDATIICITKNRLIDYNTCLLAAYVAQEKTLKDITLTSPNIIWYRGVTVINIERNNKCVMLNTGETIAYDYLLLTVGTETIEQESKEKIAGVTNFYTLEDAQRIKDFIEQYSVTKAVIVGCGLTGLECADALVKRGIDVTLIEAKATVLPALLDTHAATWLTQKLLNVSPKIHIIGNDTVKHIAHALMGALGATSKRVTGVTTAAGRFIEAQLVVFALGGQPATALARKAGLDVDQGISVDDCFKTSDDSIYASGDCAVIKYKIAKKKTRSTTWPEATIQGMLAAYAIAGQQRPYAGITPVYMSAFFGIPFAYVGERNHTAVVYCGIHAGINYYSFFIDTTKKVIGFILFGSREYVSRVKKIIETGESFEVLKTELDKDINLLKV